MRRGPHLDSAAVPAVPNPPELSFRVVVLAYGAGGEFVRLLESLRAEGVDDDRVLVVHNPSEPEQQPPVAPSGVEVVSTGRNLGYAAGMNAGIERQQERGCDALLLLTHDARLRPGALAELLRAAASDPGYGALGPALMLAGTETPFSFGGETGRSGSLRHLDVEPPASGGIAPVEWIDGGTMLVRSEAISRVGGFDERLWSYCEDADLCLRISRAGFRIGVALAARADQAPGGSKRPGAWSYLLARNGLAYSRSYAGRRGLLAALGRSTAEALAGFAMALARRLRLRPGPPGEPLAIAVGSVRGMIDYLRGRWGPPPTDLPGLGDLGNTGLAEANGGADDGS